MPRRRRPGCAAPRPAVPDCAAPAAPPRFGPTRPALKGIFHDHEEFYIKKRIKLFVIMKMQ
jgi:hypothetical protein